MTHWKRPWYWGRLKAGEGDDRGWNGWMASPTRWMWVWVNSRSWWWKGRPGVLRFMGSQRVGHDWATELNWIYLTSQLIKLINNTVLHCGIKDLLFFEKGPNSHHVPLPFLLIGYQSRKISKRIFFISELYSIVQVPHFVCLSLPLDK